MQRLPRDLHVCALVLAAVVGSSRGLRARGELPPSADVFSERLHHRPAAGRLFTDVETTVACNSAHAPPEFAQQATVCSLSPAHATARFIGQSAFLIPGEGPGSLIYLRRRLHPPSRRV